MTEEPLRQEIVSKAFAITPFVQADSLLVTLISALSFNFNKAFETLLLNYYNRFYLLVSIFYLEKMI
jgi:hypothetical protein